MLCFLCCRISGVTSEHPAGVCEGREGGKVQVVINMERDGLSALLRENLQDPFVEDFSLFWNSSAAAPCAALGAWASVSL